VAKSLEYSRAINLQVESYISLDYILLKNGDK
jgi:hypothetical protein